MKCPHCYCNYDDSERECPMCGTRSSLISCKNPKHKSISHPYTKQTGGRTVPTMVNDARTRKTAPPRSRTSTPARPQTRKPQPKPAYNQSSKETAESIQRRKRRIVKWVVIAVLLLNFLPAILGGIFSLVSNFSDLPFLEHDDIGFGYSDHYEEEPVAEPADMVSIVSEYYCEELDLYLIIRDDETYELYTGDSSFEETGYLYLLYNDPEDDADSFYFTEQFPADKYESWVYYFERNEEYIDEDGTDYSMVVGYHLLDDPETLYFDNLFADAPWLPLDRAVMLEAY